MVTAGTTNLVPASNQELCRRMALDLIGEAPSQDEIAANCTGKTPEQMARAFMASPRFGDVERRFWVQRIGSDPTTIMADNIADADRMYYALANGTLGYDDFVAQMLAHPVTTTARPVAAGDDVTNTVQRIFKTFLGRSPAVAEIADYANLLRPWLRRFEDRYNLGYGYYTYPAAIDPNACQDPVLGTAACTSTLLGAPTTIDPQVTPSVPAGHSQTSGNLFYYEMVIGNVPTPLETELEKPGRLLATRDELWDTAADLALARYTGWWRSSSNQPDTVLPEVQHALGTWFRAQQVHDVRELYVVVLTSLLYTTAADYDSPPDVSPWATGPLKLLTPEQMLDSVGRALGRQVGLCDTHTNEPVGRNFYWPDRLRTPQPADFYGFGYDFYYSFGQALGGCLGAVQPPTSPGLPALLGHIDLSKAICSAPSVLLPTTVDPSSQSMDDAAAVADYLYAQLLSRDVGGDERTFLSAAATACFADSSCQNVGGLAQEMCGAIVRSTSFLYY
jgi:hypothetical protein